MVSGEGDEAAAAVPATAAAAAGSSRASRFVEVEGGPAPSVLGGSVDPGGGGDPIRWEPYGTPWVEFRGLLARLASVLDVLSRASDARPARPLRAPEVEDRCAMTERRLSLDAAVDGCVDRSVDEVAGPDCSGRKWGFAGAGSASGCPAGEMPFRPDDAALVETAASLTVVVAESPVVGATVYMSVAAGVVVEWVDVVAVLSLVVVGAEVKEDDVSVMCTDHSERR